MTDIQDTEFADLEPVKDLPINNPTGIAAIALTLAMRYHDMSMIKDGALYQQYKLEGRNILNIALADVFDTAIQIEAHLMGASERFADLVIDVIQEAANTETDAAVPPDDASPSTPPDNQSAS